MALGGGALVAAAATGGLALSQSDQLQADCPDGVCADTQSLRDAQSELEALSLTTDILWPVGAVALGVGLVWLIVELASGDEAPPEASASRTGTVCRPGGCFVDLGVF